MENRYCNITGSQKIKDTFDLIPKGFSKVQVDMDEVMEDTDDLQRQVNKVVVDRDTTDGNLQRQINSLVVDGDSSPAIAQALAGTGFSTLKEYNDDVSSQLAEMSNIIQLDNNAELGGELTDGIGWTSTGWTGNFATGFNHATGNTNPLTRSIGATGQDIFLVSFHISSPASRWNVTVTIGNSAPFEIYTGDSQERDYVVAVQSISDGVLSFNPEDTFDGTITNISVKKVIAVYDAAGEKQNTFIGQNTGKTNIEGFGNVAVGEDSLKNNASGFWNVGVGYKTLEKNVGGSRNVGIGFNALVENISGQRNQAIGSFSLPRNTTGVKNVSIGSDAMFLNTVGNENIGIGFSALSNNLSGNNNIAIGVRALTNNNGDNNIGIGSETLSYNTTGELNLAIGRNALYGSSGGNYSYNVGIGHNAGLRITKGKFNTLIGSSSGSQNKDGEKNTILGYEAGAGATGQSTSNNTIIGYQAGKAINTGSDNNTLIGYLAGDSITTGNGNIIIGANQDTPAPTTSNFLNIGGRIYADLSVLKFGLGIQDPKARLHIGATTAGIPSIIIEQGAVPAYQASDMSGAIYYDGTDLYFTNHQGIRRKIAFVD